MNFNASVFALLVAVAPAGVAFAQAPAGRGGAAAPAGPVTNVVATPAQIQAVADLNSTLAPLTLAVTNARNGLAPAALIGGAVPMTSAQIAAKAQELADAETKLALARAVGIARIQASSNKLSPEQYAAVRAQSAGTGGRGGATRIALNIEDRTGFSPIFDGKTLDGWDGAPDIWFVDDGAISSRGGGPAGTTYIVYARALVKDFELKGEYKIMGANTGLQYRSRLNGGIVEGHGGHLPDITPEAARGRPGAQPTPPFGRGNLAANAMAKWDIGGYQFDLGGANTGNLYEQDGRGTVINAGTIGELVPGLTGPLVRQLGSLGDVSGVEKPGEWNTFHLIARGHSLTHIVNGRLLTQSYDNDPNYFAAQGHIALQIEGGGQIWYRNLSLKQD